MRTETKRIREDEPTRTLSCLECEGQYRFDAEYMYIGKTSMRIVCADCGQKHTVLIIGGGVQSESNL